MRGITGVLLGMLFFLAGSSTALAGSVDGSDPKLPPPPSTDREYDATIGVDFDGSGTSPKGKDILKGCAIVTNLNPEQLLDYLGGTGQDLINFDPANLPEDTFFHFISCPVITFGNINWMVWEVTDPVPRPVIEAVALAAYNSAVVPLPAPLTSPDGTRDIPLITQLPTWYWTDSTLWQPGSVTATIPEFNISVTATVTPTTSWWDPGDGSTPITCQAGDTWTPGSNDNDAPCSYTYTNTTQHDGTSEPYKLTTTIEWTVTYTCVPANNCTGPPNVPGSIITNVTRDIWVTEIKGLITH